MRTKAIKDDSMEHVLALLTRRNEVACRVALAYGLRIGDVLSLRRWQIEQGSAVIKEHKTGKRRRLRWSQFLQKQMLSISGDVYVIEHRLDKNKHRTRQAVYKDIRRAAKALRIDGCIGTHSFRKSYAVRKFAATGSVKKVRELLNHSDEAVTMLYVLAEIADTNR